MKKYKIYRLEGSSIYRLCERHSFFRIVFSIITFPIHWILFLDEPYDYELYFYKIISSHSKIKSATNEIESIRETNKKLKTAYKKTLN